MLSPGNFLDLAFMRKEGFHSVLSVAIEVVVQCLLADLATDALISIHTPEHNYFTVENISRLSGRKFQFFSPAALVLSGNSPGIQRDASAAGNTRRSGARAVGLQNAVFNQRRHDSGCVAVRSAHCGRGVASRQLATIKHDFKNIA